MRKQQAQRAVVIGLEALDTALDRLPRVWREDAQWHGSRWRGWGCQLNLSGRSSQLDERWGTGVWEAVDE